MNLEEKDLRGHWKNNENYYNFNFYPQNEFSKELKCSISLKNNNLIYDGDVSIEKDEVNNEYFLYAGDYTFKIKQFNKNENYMMIEHDEFGTFDLSK